MDISTVHFYGRIIELARRNARVRVVTKTNDWAGLAGTARAVTNDRGGFLQGDDHIDRAHLWLTSGMEFFIPFGDIEAIEEVEA